MAWLLVASVLAQGADAMTMRLQFEANPLIVVLGPTAYLAKIALILGVTALAWSLPRLPSRWRLTRRSTRPTAWLLGFWSFLVGSIGMVSNLLAG